MRIFAIMTARVDMDVDGGEARLRVEESVPYLLDDAVALPRG